VQPPRSQLSLSLEIHGQRSGSADARSNGGNQADAGRLGRFVQGRRALLCVSCTATHGHIGKASAVINSYFAPFNHKPTSTNVAVLELGEPEQLVEIQMVAVRPRASSELSDQPDVRFGMTDFAIDPPIRILGHSGTFVRSTDQAAAFMREHMLQHVDGHATEVLRRLEDVSSAEEARDAAKAFRTWIASGLRATPKGSSTKSSSYGDKRAGALRAPRPRRSRRKETPGAVANVKRRAHIA
jgi:hypothetical protein